MYTHYALVLLSRLFTTHVRFDWVYHGHFKGGVHTLCTGPSIKTETTLVRFDRVYHGHFKVGVHTLCTGPSIKTVYYTCKV